MNAIDSHTSPPRWLEAAVAALLPPIYREPVLGDLEERFAERGPHTRWLGYLGDVVTTVPQVLRSQMRPARIRVCAWRWVAHGDLRTRAEGLQTQIWTRNASGFAAVAMVVGSFLLNARGAWHFQELVSLAIALGWIGAACQSWVRGRSTSVPPCLPEDELRAFHRRELIRQRDLGIRAYVYWFVPAVLLILYAQMAVPGFHGGAILLASLGMQTCVLGWANAKARKYFQRELDHLEQEAAQA